MATPTPLQDELIALEKTLAGYHPTHYIRDSLIARIKILKVKAAAERSQIAHDKEFSLAEQLKTLETTLAGYHPTHYIRSSLESQIDAIQVRITQKKTRN